MKISIEVDEVSIMEKVQKGLTNKQVEAKLVSNIKERVLRNIADSLVQKVTNDLIKQNYRNATVELQKKFADYIKTNVFTPVYVSKLAKQVIKSNAFEDLVYDSVKYGLKEHIGSVKVAVELSANKITKKKK